MTGLRLSCGACKFLRRKCKNGCIFAPYFYYDQAESHFAAVHKVFGASNVSKHLSNLPVHYRSEAAITISYEALARAQDYVYGCVGHIFALQQQVAQLQKEIELLEVHFANQATNFVSGQSSQLATNFNSAPQFSAELDIMNSLSYGGEEPPEPFHARYSNLILADDMNPQISLLTPWAEQTSGFDSANEPKTFLSDPLSDIDPWSNTGNPLASYCCPLDVTSL